jgi:hypothetical protein
MTKKEIIKKIDEINMDVEDAFSAINTLKACLKDIQSKLEDFPEEESEIED